MPVGIHCPHCPPGASRISERDLTGYTTNRVPANAKELRTKFACTRQHPSVVLKHNTRMRPAVFRLPSMVGFVHPHRFRNVPSSGRFEENTYLEESRLSPTNTKTNRAPVRLWVGMVYNPIHIGVDCTADRVMLLSAVADAHHMVNPSLQLFHARVEALETVQAAQTGGLKLQLNVQKAYVAEAAQTTSNIRVEMSEQVHLLQEKVKKLAEKLKSPRTSLSASHHS
ncbi:hypothetical protein PHMEG_0006723 [Phytophthora megakarya]|uniref:Uncharacterized protein n=1 Tax=Phytophthora megakarya TaxID=4795 RepID=A0A225WN62_9STRA|nr:hypothetical protein PHMEG_0006723 [Phytophthora megakarya]